jgi:hypothetical protein
MKRQLAFILFVSLFAACVFSSTFIVAGCGGGGGGGGGGPTPLATGTFVKTIDDAVDGWWFIFFDDDVFDFVHAQMLYQADEVNGAGYVSAISFKQNNAVAAAVTCPNVTIKLGHTSITNATGLNTDMATNVEQGRGSLVTVLDNETVTIPPGSAGDYFSIPVNKSFYYNGVDSLVVDFTRTSFCDSNVDPEATAGVATGKMAFSTNSGTPNTGLLSDNMIHMKFTFAGGDNPPFSVGGSSNPVPFTSNTDFQRVQDLYLSSDIDGSGPITGVGIEVDVLTTEQTYTVSVKLGHATVSTLDTDYDANYSGSPKTVANAVTFTVPAGVPAGSYVWIPLTGSFNYNGTDNLILEFVVSSATGDTFYTYHDHGSGDVRLLCGPSDASIINPITIAIQHAKFRFNGGTMDVLTPDGMTGGVGITFPFYNTDGRVQALYRAAELGTKRTISKIAFRARDNTVAETGFAYTVVMSHTSATTLGTDFAANLPSPVTVFNSTLDLPAALSGDWYEIPLSTSFNYNGTDNLVVEIDGTGGVAGNAICIVDAATIPLYTSRMLWSATSGAATGSVVPALSDVRFTLK